MLAAIKNPIFFAVPIVLCSISSLAFAQEPAAEPTDSAPPAPAPQPTVVTPIAPPPDDLTGHFVIAPRVAYVIPMGSADSDLSQRGPIRAGGSVGGDLAYGISSYVALQARFDYGWFGSGQECPVAGMCSGRMMAFGLGAEYHRENGASFDPWMRAGAGYRIMDFRFPGRDLRYGGIEWLHLAVGGDWYGAGQFGFGPYIALDLGFYGVRPGDRVDITNTAYHTFMSFGLRGVFDPSR